MSGKGIFCLETDWCKRLDEGLSVQPMLKLLGQHGIRYVHRNVPNSESLKYYLDKWKQTGYRKYPILYLACHGENGCIKLSDFRRRSISIDDLAQLIGSKCKGRIVYFGSCGTLDLSRRTLRKFLEDTGALAVCGFKKDINWLQSTAFDLLVFEAMQENAFDGRGIGPMRKAIERNAGSLAKHLGFHFESLKG